MSREEVILGLKNTSGDDVTIVGLEIENKTDYHQERLWPADSEDLHKKMHQLYQKLERDWHNLGYISPETRLRSVLEEAILNAWKHGNKENPDKAKALREAMLNAIEQHPQPRDWAAFVLIGEG